ncbi:cytochrome b6f subunit family protein [Prochlorococcus marinus]|uniref:cytochrome b6-f complex subunit PetP n=1 Tax=Prochlorococcus marinus TaxID=1219 RepID=UPI0022B41CEC|nr:cytochrome b6f subunit family protein [Prochlorococcus marinus]
MKINPLIPVGSVIKIEKAKIENVLPKKILDDLPQMINVEVIDYKMTDGMDIGYVLMTENNMKIWIFDNELNEQTKREYKIESSNKPTNLLTIELLSRIDKVEYELNGNRSIKKLANPLNLIKWLIFTLKDIF